MAKLAMNRTASGKEETDREQMEFLREFSAKRPKQRNNTYL